MSWVNRLWTVCSSAVDAGVSLSTTILHGIGSLSAMAGGAGLAFAAVANEQLNATYYGSAFTPGELFVGINAPAINFNISERIPFQHVLTKEGQMLYDSTSYFPPEMVSLVSSALIAGGTLLKVAGANLKKWHEYRDDKKFLKQAHHIEYLLPPSKAEYRYTSAEAALLALSYASMSGAVIGGAFSLSSLNDIKGSFTYPSSGDVSNKSQYYEGPVASTSIPLTLNLKQNTTLDLPFVDVQLLIEQTATAKAVANVTYGGGLFFKAMNSKCFPLAIPAALAVSTHQASRFFSRKAIQARDERMADAREMRYGGLG